MVDNITSVPTPRAEDGKRKRRALLAGGLVLGLGAAVTFAAWSDDVVANGLFNTGTFELQGSTDGSVFADYDGTDSADTAELLFTLDSLLMAPSQTVYAPLTIATSSATTLDGTFTLADVAATGDYEDVLTYRVFQESAHDTNCNPDDAAALTTIWAGGPSAVVSGGEVQVGLPLAVEEEQATTQSLCIAVTLGGADATAAANQTAVEDITRSGTDTSVTWTFNGQSTDEI